VFHVNGDDVEAVAQVMELAIEWRQKWKTDVVVRLFAYVGCPGLVPSLISV